MIDLAGFELDLHSTVVLLKVLLLLKLPKTGIQFTFYCSSIKRNFGLPALLAKPDLHSTVVLLKGEEQLFFPGRNSSFTFYCSSIKSKLTCRRGITIIPFTFYCSSIKSSLNIFLIIFFYLIYILL